jgi:DNA-binding LacI/PurR family transcriptional regulator
MSNPVLTATLPQLRSVAEALRVTIDVFEVRSSGDLEQALARLQEARPDGALVAPDLLLLSNRADIAEALAKSRLPAVYPFREYAGVGGLVVHGGLSHLPSLPAPTR